ncbi:MAG: phage tail protein I [Pseudomonadota bacterium]|nr:phage tail protein I [Pseudomonadota bacterium]
MSDLPHLRPNNASPLEIALSRTGAYRFSLIDASVLATLHDPMRAPVQFLPALAKELSVEEEWDLAETEAQQRGLLANAYVLNAKKGTPFAVKRGLSVLGFDGVSLVEGFDVIRHDGEVTRDGSADYRGADRWLLFDAVVPLADDVSFDARGRARFMRGLHVWKRFTSKLRALRLTLTLDDEATFDRSGSAFWHIGMRLSDGPDTPRDGRYHRGGQRFHRHDETIVRDGSADYGPRERIALLRFGASPDALDLAVRMALNEPQPVSLRFDGLVRRDGRYRRGHDGAIDVEKYPLRIGPLLSIAGRGVRRDGSARYDGAIDHSGFGLPTALLTLTHRRAITRDGTYSRSGSSPWAQVRDGTHRRDGSARFGDRVRYAGETIVSRSVQ